MSEDRIINPELEDIGEERLENTLRPQTLDEYIGQDKVKENINAQIPLKRMGEAEEIAKVVYFLGCDESSYVTGQVINVDGGMIM